MKTKVSNPRPQHIFKPEQVALDLKWQLLPLGCFFAWIGLLIPALRVLYDYAWFVGFGVSFATHFALMKAFPP